MILSAQSIKRLCTAINSRLLPLGGVCEENICVFAQYRFRASGLRPDTLHIRSRAARWGECDRVRGRRWRPHCDAEPRPSDIREPRQVVSEPGVYDFDLDREFEELLPGTFHMGGQAGMRYRDHLLLSRCAGDRRERVPAGMLLK